MGNRYQIILADIPLNIQVASEETEKDLALWLLKEGYPLYREDTAEEIPPVTQEELNRARVYYAELYEAAGLKLTEPVLEYELMQTRFSDALLKHGASIFHGAAFEWRGRAYIFTAASGTGKTTQYRRWRECFGEEVRIMNGDKPVLKIEDIDGEPMVTVYPSPWHGKERYGRGTVAPLAGIIYLEQGDHNEIRRLTPEETGIPLFTQLIFSADDADTIRLGADWISRLAKAVPVWKLVNLGDHDSARLTHDAILDFEESQGRI